MKYQYLVYAWGQIFNEQFDDVNPYESKRYLFDTEEEASVFASEIKKIAKQNKATVIVKEQQGYFVHIQPTCHRIVEYKGNRYYSEYKWNWLETPDVLEYSMTYKWYPGFNDYTVEQETGEDVNYDEVEIISEWITGAFNIHGTWNQ